MFYIWISMLCFVFLGDVSKIIASVTKTYTAVFLDPGEVGMNCIISKISDTATIAITLETGSTQQEIFTINNQHTFTCPRNGSVLELGSAIFITVTLGVDSQSLVFLGATEGTAGSDAFIIYEDSSFQITTQNPIEYMAMTYCDVVGICQLAIAAIEHANVEITLPKSQNFTNPSCIVVYNGTQYDKNNPKITESIPRGAVLQIQAACDLTGTLVTTTNHIAVFSGSHSIVVGWGDSKDMMIEQLVPTIYWGQEYIVYPFPLSLNGDIISVLALEADTEVRIMGYGQYILQEARQFIRRRIESDRPVRIWASKKVSVAQYILDYANEESAMIIVPPVTQYIGQTAVDSAMFHYLTSKSNTISWKTSSSVAATSNLVEGVDVKTTDYYVGRENVQQSSDFTIEGSNGNDLGGYRAIQENSGSSLLATSLGFKFDSTAPASKPHVPGDEVDNDGDGHVDEDTCTVDDWGTKTDCKSLEPVGNRDSSGRSFLIPLLHVSGNTATLFSTMNIIGTPTDGLQISWGSNLINAGPQCFKTSDISPDPSSTNPIIITPNSPQSTTETGIYVVQTAISGSSGTMFAGFPEEVLGLEYFALTHCSDDSTCQHACSLAAAYDNTQVIIPGRYSLSLNKRQTFAFNDSNDISGTYIRSNNPIAVTCGGMVQNTGVSQFQIPPTNSWGKIYRVIFSNSDSGTLRFLTSDGNTVVTLFEYEYDPMEEIDSTGKELTKLYTYRTVHAINDPGETISITIENNTAYFLEASKPILLVYLPSQPEFPIILVGSTDATMKTMTTVTSVSSGSCGGQTMSYARLDGQEYFVPYYLIDGFMTSWWMNLNLTTDPHPVIEQIPGDNVDNDGDGLVDEDFCGYLVTELDGKSFLFDIDIDGALNEDCKGCAMGQELNEYLGCSLCQIGTYRERVGVDKCITCDVNYTTFHTASDSSSKCVDVCFEGTEYDHTTNTCRECNFGFYKSVSSADWININFNDRWYCKACPDNKTTLYRGTIQESHCTEHCVEGYGLVPYGPGNQCSPCSIGWYKSTSSEFTQLSEMERWNCIQCPDHKTTKMAGADDIALCVEVCIEGHEYDQATGTCRECNFGFYKSVSSADWQSNSFNDRWYCKACPDNKTTLYRGTIDQSHCTAQCVEGYELVPYGPGSQCSPCSIGWYKNTSSESTGLSETDRWNCTQCPDNKTTKMAGSVDIALCVEPCMEGYELNDTTSTCTPCEIGFYKEVVSTDMSVDTVTRWTCIQCPDGKTTLDIGTKNSTECRDHCLEGYGLDVYRYDGQCRRCEYGAYKVYSSSQTDRTASERWNCSYCATNETTLQQASISPTDCVVRCLLGQEYNVSTQVCDDCAIGFYKNATGNLDTCFECPNNQTTDNLGTTDGDSCRPVKRVCYCPCKMVNIPKNYSEAEKQQVLDGHRKDMQVDVKKLSSSIRKKISAPDNRPSSTAFGGLGIIMITFSVALLVFFDFPTLKEHAQMFYHNVKAILHRG